VPIRIYALAKELGIDSKELVEVCTKAGIPSKGSALASLDDDEVVKVKAFLEGPTRSAESTSAGSPAGSGGRSGPGIRIGRSSGPLGRRRTVAGAKDTDTDSSAPISRDDYIAPTGRGGKIKVIDTRGRKQRAADQPEQEEPVAAEPEAPEEAPAPEAPEVPRSPAAEAPATESPSEPSPSEPAEPSEADKADQMVRPEDDPLAPRDPGSIKVIGGPKSRKKGSEREPQRRKPVINVAPAPMPKIKQPPAKPKETEPKAQKPEIRLPKDAMTARPGQRRPPLEHLTEKKSKKDSKRHAPSAGDEETPTARRGRGKSKHGDSSEPELAGMASHRADRKRRRTASKVRLTPDREQDSAPPRRRRTLVRRGTNTAAPRKGKVALELPCTVRSFSEAAGVSASQVQQVLMGLGVMLTINSTIDDDVVELLAEQLGVDLEFKQHETLEDSLITNILETEDDPEQLQPRAPVVTFLGHVDHGKTSLLDYLIGTDVVSGEAGGITQHIRAYRIKKDGRPIAFVDTPGHEAFTEMRARGANVTDVAVLVVAADDGIMPQTEEAISHAQAAGVPIVVALNKSDLPGADPNRVMTQMTEHNMTPSEWGGDIEVVSTSAVTGQGMDELLETILTIADLHEYGANPQRDAMGTCLEAEQEGGRGVIAKVIVQNGTLHVGDVVVCGTSHGRVKAMYDTLRPNVRLKTAGPSTPVNITGLDTAPAAGERFFVLEDISQAREIAQNRENQTRQQSLSSTSVKISFEDFQTRLAEGRLLSDDAEVVTLNLIIRADVRGSIEAIQKELAKLEHPEVQIKILQATVGGITVADVTLASASHAVIIGFNVIPDEAARALADERGVEIRRYDVIYKVTDDIRALLEGKLKPEERVIELGQAVVKQVFGISRVGAIAGCYVIRGSVERGCRVRVNRDGRTIGDYDLESLRREKEDVKEVSRGMECGMKLSGFNDVKQDDVLEAYKIEEVARTL
jgi:translation initiation factor IF-2